MNILPIVTMVTDAMSIATALMPLLQQQLDGKKEVTEEDVKQALAGKDAALESFDALIAARVAEATMEPGNVKPSRRAAIRS